jgi:hypothetical protein
MNLDYGILFNSFLEVIIPLLTTLLKSVILWVLIPGLLTQVLFKSKEAYSIGAFLGLVALFSYGQIN